MLETSIPVYVASLGPANLRLTGELADGWIGNSFFPATADVFFDPIHSIQIHSAAGAWTLRDGKYLAARMHTFHSHDGFAVEDGWIHLPDGNLLATVRQTRLAG